MAKATKQRSYDTIIGSLLTKLGCERVEIIHTVHSVTARAYYPPYSRIMEDRLIAKVRAGRAAEDRDVQEFLSRPLATGSGRTANEALVTLERAVLKELA